MVRLFDSMELSDLGFDDWFRQRQIPPERPDCSFARIARVDRDRYLVRNERGEVRGETTGRLQFAAASDDSLPCVGDWVLVQYFNEGNLAIIHDVLPRKSFLRRKSAGAKIEYQMIASSIEDSFVEIRTLSEKCRFKDCTHTTETGCAVLEAVAAGELDRDRYRNYLKLVRESDFNEMTYAQRRKTRNSVA